MQQHIACSAGKCDGFEFTWDGEITADVISAMFEAQDKHADEHRAAELAAGNHIRKQINPRRIRTGNQFYKDRVQLSASENGSQTLCGAPATTQDLGWGDTRSDKSLAYVSCEACKAARRAAA